MLNEASGKRGPGRRAKIVEGGMTAANDAHLN